MYQMEYVRDNRRIMVEGVSYIGKPISNTAMYVSKKIEEQINNLANMRNCLVFAEKNVCVEERILKKHVFVFCDRPQLEYAHFIEKFAEKKREREKGILYRLEEPGYYISETAEVGENAYIEQGVVIGHDVKIGKNATILVGAVLKNCCIGDNVLVNENATVGANGFTMAEDFSGNKLRIPTLGKVVIGDNVEIGANSNISCGSAGNTILENYVKLDALTFVGHDAFLAQNVEVIAGSCVAGFVTIEEGGFVGVNASIRNRVHIGKNTVIGMGAVVTNDVEDGVTVVGNPAHPLVKKV